EASAPWPAVTGGPHALVYRDANYEDLVGWKEIVIRPGPGARLLSSTVPVTDRSAGLTRYPEAETAAPPAVREARASLRFDEQDPRVAPGGPSGPPPPLAPPGWPALAVALIAAALVAGRLIAARRSWTGSLDRGRRAPVSLRLPEGGYLEAHCILSGSPDARRRRHRRVHRRGARQAAQDPRRPQAGLGLRASADGRLGDREPAHRHRVPR